MNFDKILEEICLKNNIKLIILSKGWIKILDNGKVKRKIVGYKFELNNYCSGSICDDKYATYEICKANKIPIVEEKIFYNSKNKNDYAIGCNSYDDIYKYFIKNKKNIVIKPINGTCGNNISHITNEKDLKEIYENRIKNCASICAGPFYEIENEYRVIILNGKVKLVYKKIRPIVVGNGDKTIKELLCEFNYNYFKNINIENDYILKENEVYEYSWKFNLSKGSKPSLEINSNIKNKVIELATKTTDILNMNFCSVDIIKTIDNKFYVMEVNTGVMMEHIINELEEGYDIAKNIYEEAVLDMMK